MPDIFSSDTLSLAFFAAAVPAVMLVGLSKGGIGGAIGLMACR